MSKYTALLQIHTPEYFTSLAVGIARGAPLFWQAGSWFPFPGQWIRGIRVRISGAMTRFLGERRVQFYSHWEWESPLMGSAVQGDDYGGNSMLFSKLIFKASPKARLLRLARVFNKKSNMNLHKAKMSNSVTLGSWRRMSAKWLANSLTFRPRRTQLLGENLLLGLCSAACGASWAVPQKMGNNLYVLWGRRRSRYAAKVCA